MIWIVGGTSDTRSLLDKLSEKINLNNVIVSVTTEYGEKLLENFNIKVIQKVLDKKEILDFIDKTNINTIIDTYHPYAENISKNILEVIKSKNIKYFRYEREVTETIFDERFESLKDMISYINLNLKNKNILSTLGSKALAELINIQDNNVYVRILPTAKSIENAEKLGFLPNQILAIQGPFSESLEKEFEEDVFSGDVKYHLGSSKKITTASGEEVRINLVPNPSHLETVASLVGGISRAKIDHTYQGNAKKVLPIVIHGDAAIAGQGIVYEVAQMMTLEGYKTGGTVHIVVNNQVGFTTNYLDARSSIYCTDIAKVTDSPVMHVNADDVEAVVHAIRFAADYRAQFGKDVYIDLLGYRKYGHNEGDEPRFTQPSLYKTISKHPNPREIYKKKLVEEGVVSDAVMSEMEKEFKNLLDQNFDEAKEIERNTMAIFMEEDWKDYASLGKLQQVLENYNTTYDVEKLRELAVKISTLPADKKFINKISRLFEARVKMVENNALDWAMGELLAYGTLLTEGSTIRISGEDVERGTFSHRHAVVKTEDNEEEYVPLRQVSDNKFDIYNSHLSEYGVLGFDYGYAMASPNTLTIWEAQFGDFVNGAQIVIDQYLVAAEEKWKIQNGLVMLLPHGFEGQGAEHSSARLERFLNLCANGNIIVANCTTPANYFHLLRRQQKFPFRKPLVVMTPKSLLRHPRVISTVEELANGSFQPVIDDATAQPEKVEKLVFCSGKLYYELLAKKEELNDDKVALVRIEQLYPLNPEIIQGIFDKYSNRKEFVWAQEEPENMGAWTYMLRNFRNENIQVIAPVASGTPAPGTHKKFEKNQKGVINRVFGVAEENVDLVRPITTVND